MENASHYFDRLEAIMQSVCYNCFSGIVDNLMNKISWSGVFRTRVSGLLLTGLMYLSKEEKIYFLKNFCQKYSDAAFDTSYDFFDVLTYVVHNEYNVAVENELLSKLIWLVMQQPRKMLTILMSQRLVGICGLPPKKPGPKQSCLDRVLVEMHKSMDENIIFKEYILWTNYPYEDLSDKPFNYLHYLIVDVTLNLKLIKPNKFMERVLVPLLHHSSNLNRTEFLVQCTLIYIEECRLMQPPTIDVWDSLVIQLAQILDEVRWNIDNYSTVKQSVCDNIVFAIQTLLQQHMHLASAKVLSNIRKETSFLHLITRGHFFPIWIKEFSAINDEIEEQFIMAIHLKYYLSYSKLNASSTQQAQEEFIFTIATYFPKFINYEMKRFIKNYLRSANNETIVEASFFLWDCVMNACMRNIVYLKTTGKYYTTDKSAWDYLINTIEKFVDVTNNFRRTRCIYNSNVDDKLKFNSLSKIVMVTKQLVGKDQVPLLHVIRYLIASNIEELDAEKAAKLLKLIAPLDGKFGKQIIGKVFKTLTKKTRNVSIPQ